jgi:hypothetical protein
MYRAIEHGPCKAGRKLVSSATVPTTVRAERVGQAYSTEVGKPYPDYRKQRLVGAQPSDAENENEVIDLRDVSWVERRPGPLARG